MLKVANKLNSGMFDVLKRALKAKGMTYAELARIIKVSEPTIKRLFVDCDCKFSRLVEICHALDLTISEVAEVADRLQESVVTLPESVEKALASSPSLFWFYILLRDEMSCEQIEELYPISSADSYLYCRDLERLGLVSLTNDNQVIRLSTHPVRFTVGGPLHALFKKVNLKFVDQTIESTTNTQEKFKSISRRMRPESAELLAVEAQAFFNRIAQVSRQDKLTSPDEDLIAYKWCLAADEASFPSLMTIATYNKGNCPSSLGTAQGFNT